MQHQGEGFPELHQNVLRSSGPLGQPPPPSPSPMAKPVVLKSSHESCFELCIYSGSACSCLPRIKASFSLIFRSHPSTLLSLEDSRLKPYRKGLLELLFLALLLEGGGGDADLTKDNAVHRSRLHDPGELYPINRMLLHSPVGCSSHEWCTLYLLLLE